MVAAPLPPAPRTLPTPEAEAGNAVTDALAVVASSGVLHQPHHSAGKNAIGNFRSYSHEQAKDRRTETSEASANIVGTGVDVYQY
jgi:hypothetical protein